MILWIRGRKMPDMNVYITIQRHGDQHTQISLLKLFLIQFLWKFSNLQTKNTILQYLVQQSIYHKRNPVFAESKSLSLTALCFCLAKFWWSFLKPFFQVTNFFYFIEKYIFFIKCIPMMSNSKAMRIYSGEKNLPLAI